MTAKDVTHTVSFRVGGDDFLRVDLPISPERRGTIIGVNDGSNQAFYLCPTLEELPQERELQLTNFVGEMFDAQEVAIHPREIILNKP